MLFGPKFLCWTTIYFFGPKFLLTKYFLDQNSFLCHRFFFDQKFFMDRSLFWTNNFSFDHNFFYKLFSYISFFYFHWPGDRRTQNLCTLTQFLDRDILNTQVLWYQTGLNVPACCVWVSVGGDIMDFCKFW